MLLEEEGKEAATKEDPFNKSPSPDDALLVDDVNIVDVGTVVAVVEAAVDDPAADANNAAN